MIADIDTVSSEITDIIVALTGTVASRARRIILIAIYMGPAALFPSPPPCKGLVVVPV
jgi:hypothetical protein